jgi:hypothetical protein
MELVKSFYILATNGLPFQEEEILRATEFELAIM